MARDYQLAVGAKKKFSATIIPKESPKGDAPEDDLPMHREVGQDVTIAYNDSFILGRVVAVKDAVTCLIEADGEMYFEKGQDTLLLPESSRCSHCGGFAFQCNDQCPIKKRKPNKRNMARESKTVNVADVLDIRPGDQDEPAWVNGDFECVVTKVKEASGKGPIKATLVHPEDDGCKITANFWKWKMSDVEELEGKLVSFNGGMTRTEYKPDKGPKMQQVSISSKTEVTILGESAHADKPLPHKASPHRDTPATQQRAQERQETASQSDLTDTDRRAKCYFGVFFSVERAYEEAKKAGLKTELSATDLKDITTGINMTYRGQYGSYLEPIFPKRKKFEEQVKEAFGAEEMSDQDIPFDEPQSTERPTGGKPKLTWKDFVHPTNKAKLGELPEGKLLGYARWALGFEPEDDDDNKDFWTAVQSMMADKRWSSPVKVLAHSFMSDPGYGEVFDDWHIDAYISEHFGCDLSSLDQDQAMTMIEEFNDHLDKIKAPKPKAKAAKQKAAMPD